MVKTNKIPLIITFFVALGHFKLNSQSASISQYYANPLYLNPAFTGNIYYARFCSNFRTQWPAGNHRIDSYLTSFDKNFYLYKFGLGGFIHHFSAGNNFFVYNSLNFSAAYSLNLTNKVNLRFGLQPNVSFFSTHFSELIFGDQLINTRSTSIDPTINSLSERKNHFSISSGLLLTEKKFWTGITCRNINRPNISFTSTIQRLPVFISLHGGYRFIFPDKRGLVVKKENFITISGNFRNQASSKQLDLGSYIQYNALSFGLQYRGVPFEVFKGNNIINQDAIIGMVGIKLQGWKVGYSFDYTISKLSGKYGNAHELSLQFEFGERIEKRKTFKKLPTMYMPYPKL